MNVKSKKLTVNQAEWGNKKAILSRYDGLNIYTLNRWISEMRENKLFRDGVVNPSHKLVFVNFDTFSSFLFWRQHGYLK